MTEAEKIESSYPLSPLQQGMLFHSLYVRQAGVYVQQLVCSLHERLDVASFEQAWQTVIARHAVLRTSFRWDGFQYPIQDVYHQIDLLIKQFDWRHLSAPEQAERLKSFLQADEQLDFELTRAPLMRFNLFGLAEADYRFIWTSHHILLDGRSRLLVLQELFAFYEAYRHGRELTLPAPHPYRDYIDWLQAQNLDKAETFWRESLKGFSKPTPVNTVENPERADHDKYEEQRICLARSVTQDLQSMVQRHELTLNTLVQGAWGVLLSRYSGENDIVFGATRACRHPNLSDTESMVGLFINTLPIRVRLSPRASLLSLLKGLRAQHVALREFEHTPLIKIQEWSDAPRGEQLFDSLVVFENYQMNSTLQALGSSWSNREFQLLERTNYPLTVAGYAGPELLLKISYNRRYFDEATITRMLGHLQMLLEGFAADLSQPLAGVKILTEAERHQLVVEWNQTQADYPDNTCLHELFEAQARRTPEAVALVCGREQMSYAELNRRADKLGRFLRQKGVSADGRVGILMERSMDMVVGQLGVLKAGGAYVPLDPGYPRERVSFMLADAAVFALLTQERLRERVPQTEALVVFLDTDWTAISENGVEDPVSRVAADNLAYVIYTSGSTGTPKGVAISHRSGVAFLQWARDSFTAEELSGVLASTSICFDLAVFELFAPLVSGGTVIIAKNALQLAELPAAAAVTLINTVPAAMKELIRLKAVPATVQVVNLAGEPLSRKLVDEVYEETQVKRVLNLYGPTEDTTYSTGAVMARRNRRAPTIGRPLANKQAYLLDKGMQPVPIGLAGELHLGGVGLARGYFQRPELTAERFIPDPFAATEGARLYRTGDLARYRADGEIEFLGRFDQQVKIRGYRIELGEIETVLSGHPFVSEVAVLDVNFADHKGLVAYVVPEDGRVITVGQLRQYLRERLPEYMVPQVFTMLPRFPLTPNGKLDRRALPFPDQDRPQLGQTYVAPRTATEKTIAAIWSELLAIQRVGVHDNFFELGGDSLLAMRLISRLRETMQVDVPLDLLFKSPTVVGFAQIIDREVRARQALPNVPVKRIPRDKDIPLSLEQEAWLLREWWEGLYSIERRLFHTSAIYRLTGPLNVTALEAALNEIVRRHQVLRSTFPQSKGLLNAKMLFPVFKGIFSRPGVQKKLYRLANNKPLTVPQPAFLGNPSQKIMPEMRLKIPVVDLRQLAASDRETASQRALGRELTQPFDYAQGPMLRALVVRLAEEEYVLSIVAHHLVFDGWSMNVFTREMEILYDDFLQGIAPTLPEPSLQYGDFAWWQREWLQGEVLEKMVAYWRGQFAGTDIFPEMNLPLANSEKLDHDFHLSGESQDRILPPLLYQGLQELSRRKDVTLYMLLLAALKTLLHRYTGKERIALFTPFANRGRAELQQMIGWLAHIHVLTTNLSGDMRFSDLLQAIRKTVLGAYEHQEIPYSLLLRTLLPEMKDYDLPGKIFATPYVFFDFRRQPEAPREMSGLNASPLEYAHDSVDAGIEVILLEHDDSLKIRLKYSRDNFDPVCIGQMLGHFQILMESILADSEQRLSELSIGDGRAAFLR